MKLEPQARSIPLRRMHTSTSGFWIIAVITWIVCSAMLYSTMFDRADASVVEIAGIAALASIPATFLSAVLGGMIALLAGATLSRHYCWIFATILALLAPSLISLSIFAVGLENVVFPWLIRFGSWMFSAVALGLVAAGAIVGIIYARHALGFGARSVRATRKAACLGLLLGLALVGISMLQSANNPMTMTESRWIMRTMLVAYSTFTFAAIGALWRAERITADDAIGFSVVLPKFESSPAEQRVEDAFQVGGD